MSCSFYGEEICDQGCIFRPLDFGDRYSKEAPATNFTPFLLPTKPANSRPPTAKPTLIDASTSSLPRWAKNKRKQKTSS